MASSDSGHSRRSTRTNQREVMTEVERVLHRSSGAMSLYERLQRDAQLREDLVELLKEFDGDAIDQIEQMQPKAGRPAVGTSGEGSGTLRNVPVRGKT